MKLSITFKNEAERVAAEHFMSWLSGQGEQDYWNWMEYREQEEAGNITITAFNYKYEKGEATLELGRVSQDEEEDE